MSRTLWVQVALATAVQIGENACHAETCLLKDEGSALFGKDPVPAGAAEVTETAVADLAEMIGGLTRNEAGEALLEQRGEDARAEAGMACGGTRCKGATPDCCLHGTKTRVPDYDASLTPAEKTTLKQTIKAQAKKLYCCKAEVQSECTVFTEGLEKLNGEHGPTERLTKLGEKICKWKKDDDDEWHGFNDEDIIAAAFKYHQEKPELRIIDFGAPIHKEAIYEGAQSRAGVTCEPPAKQPPGMCQRCCVKDPSGKKCEKNPYWLMYHGDGSPKCEGQVNCQVDCVPPEVKKLISDFSAQSGQIIDENAARAALDSSDWKMEKALHTLQVRLMCEAASLNIDEVKRLREKNAQRDRRLPCEKKGNCDELNDEDYSDQGRQAASDEEYRYKRIKAAEQQEITELDKCGAFCAAQDDRTSLALCVKAEERQEEMRKREAERLARMMNEECGYGC